MAGWSIISNGSSLDCAEILRSLRKRGFSLDFVSNGCLDGENSSNANFRFPFDQIISIFLSRNHESLPAMVADGRSVDLFRLYCVVRERGGYDSVTQNGSWGAVAEVAGLGSVVGSSVKLVYAKYMNALDLWLHGILHEGVSGNREESLGVLSLDKLELEVLDWNKGVDPTDVSFEGNQTQDLEIAKEPAIDDDHDKGVLGSSLMNNSFKRSRDEDEIRVVDASSTSGRDETEASDTSAGSSCSRKIDRNSLLGLLNWVTVIAKNPVDPNIGKICEKSRRNACRDKYWVQILVAREALILRKQGGLSDERSPLKKKKRIHPSLYDVESNHERLRCSPRLSLCKQSPPSASSLECADSDLDKSLMPCNTGSAKRVFRTYASLSVENVVGLFCKDQLKKRVPIGAHFQAEVPVWTGPISDAASDDSKWLGTQQWPLIMNSVQPLIEEEPTGKGRSHLCACRHPGSVECVKFHVAEKRLFLKYELGPAFYSWKFDGMGEEVSLSWTENEEERFKALVRLNPPSLHKSFWDPIYKSFPSRSRQSLVSYYFNVFLLRQRGYQNRMTAKDISSDDESEFGFLGSSFGHDAGKR